MSNLVKPPARTPHTHGEGHHATTLTAVLYSVAVVRGGCKDRFVKNKTTGACCDGPDPNGGQPTDMKRMAKERDLPKRIEAAPDLGKAAVCVVCGCVGRR